jgi:thioredoxin-related protein
MKKITTYSVLFLTFILLSSFKGGDDKKIQKATPDEKIKWYSFQEAYDLNKTKPKKIFIDVFTEWCGWCKKMDASTFTDPRVIKLMNKYFYAVKLDAEMKDTVVMDSAKFVNPNPMIKRSTHQLATALLNNQMSYPTTVYLNEKFALLSQPIPGYQTPENLEPILFFLGEELFNKQSWDEFVKTYKPGDSEKLMQPEKPVSKEKEGSPKKPKPATQEK